jgi:DNA-binding transcriptional ArsR family regulator
LAAYHLSSLQAAGLVERIRERGYVRFYASDAGFTKEELRLARVLRRDQAYRITLLLLRTEAIAPAEIAETIGLSRATVSYHLNLLVKASVLDVRDEGRNRYYSLRDPKRVRRLLHELPPLPGRVDEFSSMWDELVG